MESGRKDTPYYIIIIVIIMLRANLEIEKKAGFFRPLDSSSTPSLFWFHFPRVRKCTNVELTVGMGAFQGFCINPTFQ